VSVAIRLAGIDRHHRDGDFDLGVCHILLVHAERAKHTGEMALHVGNHHLLDLELRHGMSGINVISADAHLKSRCASSESPSL
jgi:hypothetical protein